VGGKEEAGEDDYDEFIEHDLLNGKEDEDFDRDLEEECNDIKIKKGMQEKKGK
jgi:hypothetical protein